MTASFNISQLANKVNTDGKLDASTGLYNQVPQANGGTGATSLASVAVTSLTAGTGISLTGGPTGAITVTNTGGAGGATETTSATDITLTNSSNRAQKASFTADNKGFVLPDATTISAVGYPIFALSNNGYNTANIYASDGGKIGSVTNGSTQAIGLSNNSNASTGWFGAGAMQVKAYANANISFATACFESFNNYVSDNFDVSPLSDSAFIFSYVNTLEDIYAVVGTVSGTTITFGTPVLVQASTTIERTAIVGLSATSALIFNHGASISSYGLTISGNTITTVSTGASSISNVSMPSVTKIDSTRVLIGYTSGTANAVRVATFNGASAPTYGSSATLIAASYGSSSNTLSALALIDTDKVIAFYSDSDSTPTIYADYARVCSISGTAITLGGQTQLGTGTSTSTPATTISKQALAISTTEAWCSNGYAVSISGTTVTSLVPAGGNPNNLDGTKSFALLGSNIVARVASSNIALNKYSSPTLLDGGINNIANKPSLSKCIALDANTFVAIGSSYQTNFPTYNLGAIVIKTNI
jgi:hypothetical protein